MTRYEAHFRAVMEHKLLLSSEEKIAVVGAGPSGLAVADYLNRRGHSVRVYEREDKAGGLLMYGIPNMKLEKWVIDRRIKLMEEEGVEFVYNADVGHNISADHLLAQYDAIALCCGAKKARTLNAKGMEYLFDSSKNGLTNRGGMIFARFSLILFRKNSALLPSNFVFPNTSLNTVLLLISSFIFFFSFWLNSSLLSKFSIVRWVIEFLKCAL